MLSNQLFPYFPCTHLATHSTKHSIALSATPQSAYTHFNYLQIFNINPVLLFPSLCADFFFSFLFWKSYFESIKSLRSLQFTEFKRKKIHKLAERLVAICEHGGFYFGSNLKGTTCIKRKSVVLIKQCLIHAYNKTRNPQDTQHTVCAAETLSKVKLWKKINKFDQLTDTDWLSELWPIL